MHYVESMMSVREMPWHKLGVVLKDPPSAEEAIKAAGLDWMVEKRPLYTPTTEFIAAQTAGIRSSVPASQRGVELPEHFATVRTSDNKVLGVVGVDYKPLQNVEAFNFMDYFVREGTAEFETAGSLHGGKVVWVMAKLPSELEIVPGDIVSSYLLLSNSHDGSRTVQAQFTPVRVVCANTLQAAVENRTGRVHRLRHTKSVTERLVTTQKLMSEAIAVAVETQRVFRRMSKFHLNRSQIQSYVEEVIPSSDAEVSTRLQNIRSSIVDLAYRGKGTEIPGVRETLWGAYNAVTEYVDHFRSGTKELNDRIESIWFGSGSEIKSRAFDRALEIVG